MQIIDNLQWLQRYVQDSKGCYSKEAFDFLKWPSAPDKNG